MSGVAWIELLSLDDGLHVYVICFYVGHVLFVKILFLANICCVCLRGYQHLSLYGFYMARKSLG